MREGRNASAGTTLPGVDVQPQPVPPGYAILHAWPCMVWTAARITRSQAP